MALFTDGNPAEIGYLRTYESGILEVAKQEGIDLDAKLSLSAEEIADSVVRVLACQGTSGNQETAARREPGAAGSDSETSAVARNPNARACIRDAYGSQLNERYGNKMREYTDAARRAEDEYFESGAGLVNRPIPKAAIPVVGGSVAGDAYFVQVTWVDAEGNEGAPCNPVVLTLGDGSAVQLAHALDPAPAGWNVYVGSSAENISLQNPVPVAVGAAWLFPGSAETEGRSCGTGQVADYFVVDHHRLLRG